MSTLSLRVKILNKSLTCSFDNWFIAFQCVLWQLWHLLFSFRILFCPSRVQLLWCRGSHRDDRQTQVLQGDLQQDGGGTYWLGKYIVIQGDIVQQDRGGFCFTFVGTIC